MSTPPLWQTHVDAIRSLTHCPTLPGINWAYVESAKEALVQHVLLNKPLPREQAESMLALFDWMQDLAREAGVLPEKALPTDQHSSALR